MSEWHDLENQVRGRSTSLKMAPFDRRYATLYVLIVNIVVVVVVFLYMSIAYMITYKHL